MALKKVLSNYFCETAQICSSTYCYHKTKIKKGVTALLTEIFCLTIPTVYVKFPKIQQLGETQVPVHRLLEICINIKDC